MASASSSRLALAWAAVRDSLWFAPALGALTGVALAVTAVRIPTPSTDSALVDAWIFSGGTDGAREVLGTIAGSLITVTGVVFSVTIVALQLASSQFTPRVVGSFVADRVNQSVLAVFIGTFTYTLLVLRTIHAEADDRETFVPHVAVTIALLLLLVSIGALIVFINHAARSIQASTILHRASQHTLARIAAVYPASDREPGDGAAAADAAAPPRVPTEPPALVTADAAGYLQAVHAGALWEAGAGRRLTVRTELHVGEFAFPGTVLAAVWPAAACDDGVARAVRASLVLGFERTSEQDVELGLVELSDIAVRALSPGINDPTTAMHCIDRLGQVLAALAPHAAATAVHTSDDGRLRLLVRTTSFERAAGLAFDQIRHYGAGTPTIVKKLLDTLRDLATAVPPATRPVLAAHVEAVRRAAHAAIGDAVELAAIDRLVTVALAAAHGRTNAERQTPGGLGVA